MKLIINADDYGWDDDANSAILQLCREEKLHGVSIMANWVNKEALQGIVIFQPLVRLGIHVVLNEGKPLSVPDQIPSLVNREGNFYSSYQLWAKYLLGLVKKEHLRREIVAQVNFLKQGGVRLFHADSHQHIHQYPFLGKTILEVLKNEGIQSVRNCQPLETNDFRRRVLALFSWFSQKSLRDFKRNDLLITYLATNSHFQKQDLLDILIQMEARSVKEAELMCHPALFDREGSYLNRRREFVFLRSLEPVRSPWEVVLQTQ